jgi:hypothetical protein
MERFKISNLYKLPDGFKSRYKKIYNDFLPNASAGESRMERREKAKSILAVLLLHTWWFPKHLK